ncbi:hypothetical protein BO78DRAFT_110104 [Aspergillus sclerotiicarbonarius CBS 121057]|uniref:Uncharacterized protein n=1 Tax=Aspergillus sclerotiicarbonarius (strain CBS 121057 / IBT 28362) TaxID=1448318 RepID=A0A319EAB6_ASPSB|nr:hypothetical protein BO78DRAFT_110104 [Aspergillus sclerotiicarbonarius CBS 121057]
MIKHAEDAGGGGGEGAGRPGGRAKRIAELQGKKRRGSAGRRPPSRGSLRIVRSSLPACLPACLLSPSSLVNVITPVPCHGQCGPSTNGRAGRTDGGGKNMGANCYTATLLLTSLRTGRLQTSLRPMQGSSPPLYVPRIQVISDPAPRPMGVFTVLTRSHSLHAFIYNIHCPK